MQLLKKNGILLFWLVLFADCYLIFQNIYDYHIYFKIALVPILTFYIFFNARKKHFIRSKTLVFLGLICAWISDILLLNNGEGFLISGMLALVGTLIFYSIFLYRVHSINSTTSYEVSIIALLILSAIYFQYYRFTKDDFSLQHTIIRTTSYLLGLMVGVMAIFASNIYANPGKRNMALQFFIPGALLFIASIAALYIYKFKYVDENYINVLVVLTYGYAQCLFAQGFTKYLKG